MKQRILGDVKSMNCHFPNCVHYADGMCQNAEARKYCIEIALAVICADKKEYATKGCDFCADSAFYAMIAKEKCEKYNLKDKVARANAHIGAKFITYVTDNHSRVYTKDSRTYKLCYCPVCGKPMHKFDLGDD